VGTSDGNEKIKNKIFSEINVDANLFNWKLRLSIPLGANSGNSGYPEPKGWLSEFF